MGLKVKTNVRTNGLGMGETSQVSARVPLSSMVVASAITATAAGLAAIGVEVFKHKVLRDENEEMVDLGDVFNGFKIQGTIDAAKDFMENLGQKVEEAELAQEAREEAEAADEEDETEGKKTKSTKKNTAKKAA